MQVSTASASACAVVWQLGTCEEIARIVHPTESRGVYACAFSGDGKLLVTVCGDNQNTVRVYEWACQRLMANGIGHNGVPPQVFGVTFDPFQASRLRYASSHLAHVHMLHCAGVTWNLLLSNRWLQICDLGCEAHQNVGVYWAEGTSVSF